MIDLWWCFKVGLAIGAIGALIGGPWWVWWAYGLYIVLLQIYPDQWSIADARLDESAPLTVKRALIGCKPDAWCPDLESQAGGRAYFTVYPVDIRTWLIYTLVIVVICLVNLIFAGEERNMNTVTKEEGENPTKGAANSCHTRSRQNRG
jgi:hypothetical protein